MKMRLNFLRTTLLCLPLPNPQAYFLHSNNPRWIQIKAAEVETGQKNQSEFHDYMSVMIIYSLQINSYFVIISSLNIFISYCILIEYNLNNPNLQIFSKLYFNNYSLTMKYILSSQHLRLLFHTSSNLYVQIAFKC